MKKLILICLLFFCSRAFTQNTVAKFSFSNYKLEIPSYQIKSVNVNNIDKLISFEFKITGSNNLPFDIINDFKKASDKLSFYYISDVFYDSEYKVPNSGIVVFKFKELGKRFTLFGTNKNLNGLKDKHPERFGKEFNLLSLLYEYNSGDTSLIEKSSKKIRSLNESNYVSDKYLDTLMVKEVIFVYKMELDGNTYDAFTRSELLSKKYIYSNSGLKIYYDDIINRSEASKSYYNNILNHYDNVKRYFNEDNFEECKNSCNELYKLTDGLKGNLDSLNKSNDIKYMHAFSLYMINKDSPDASEINTAVEIFNSFSGNEDSKYYLKATLTLGNIYYLKEDFPKAIKCYTTIISKASPEDEVYRNAFDNLKMISSDK